jgi:hypothetical protein
VREDRAGPHLENRLDDAAEAGHRLHMPEVRLERGHHDGVVLGVRFHEDVADGAELDRIAQRGTGAVRFHVGDVARLQSSGDDGRPDDLLLRGAVRDGQPGALSVLADRGAANYREHGVAISSRVRQSFYDQHGGALRAHVAVGAIVECLALPVRGQHVRVREHDEDLGVMEGVDRPSQRDVALAATQPGYRQVERRQRGGTGSVGGQAWSAPAEEVGQPPGYRERRDAGGEVPIGFRVRKRIERQRIVEGARADVDAAVAVPQRRRIHVGVLDRLPRGLHKHPLLRIDVLRLQRRDAEEGRVELVDGVQETAPGRTDLSLLTRFARGEGVHVPAVAGQRSDTRPALAQEALEFIESLVAAGEPQAYADDRDRLAHLVPPGGARLSCTLLSHSTTGYARRGHDRHGLSPSL